MLDNLATFGVVLPPERVAIGVRFDDPTLSFGLLTFDPPTIGTSSTTAWVGYNPTAITCVGVNGRLVPCNFGFELRSGWQIDVDVKPLSVRNGVNLKSNDNVRVASLGNAAFDALQVDPASARLGPMAARPRRQEVKDYNGDGFMDLGLIFRVRDVGFGCGDQKVTLAAATYAGEQVIGADSVHAWNCRR